MVWTTFLYMGIGMALGVFLKPTFQSLQTVFHTFQTQSCVNTVLPKRLEAYIPRRIVNLIAMTKFLYEYLWVQAEQSLSKSCVKKGRVYHVKFVIENKMYALIIKPERGPGTRYLLIDENGIDQTRNVQAYLRGVCAVQRIITPESIGFTKLIKCIHHSKDQICYYRSNEALTQ